MCGIIGYIGRKENVDFLISRLKKLEYRGYDSAGIGYLQDEKIKTIKSVGKIAVLESKVPNDLIVTNAVAHTRWATNGKVTEKNAHPHLSKNGIWSVVHNGIIENDKVIRNSLKFKPDSETDTSVISECLEEKNVEKIDDFINVFNGLTGSFAVIAQNKNLQNSLFLAKKYSPLFVAKNAFCDFLIASDPICFVGFSNEYYTFEDNEFAEISNGKIIFYSKDKMVLSKFPQIMDSTFENSEKDGYPHFMLKEILEQKQAILRQVDYYKNNNVLNRFDKNFLNGFNEITFIGCGTAYHAGLMGAKYFQKVLNINAHTEMASEFIYSKPIFASKKSLFIFVSQSGETADTITALKLAKSKKATTIVLTNVLYSTLAKKGDYVLPICAGPEIAVASTKAYTAQLTALYMFASYFSKNKNYYNEVENLAEKLLNFNFQKIDWLAEKIKKHSYCIFIGKDLDYITACEASLKLKEIAYINSLNYPSGELKHGFLALVKKNIPILVFANEKEINQKTINSASEAKSRGGKLIYFTNDRVKNSEKYTIRFDFENELLLPVLSIIPAQYLAYKVSILKGIDPDKPRNLAKSVTVE